MALTWAGVITILFLAASVKVKVGDIIEIQFGTRTVKVEVLDIQETTKKEEAKDLFKYL